MASKFVNCIVCNKAYQSFYFKNTHRKSNKHVNNLQNVKNPPTINGEKSCVLCNKKVKARGWSAHARSSLHIKKMKEIDELEEDSDEEEDEDDDTDDSDDSEEEEEEEPPITHTRKVFNKDNGVEDVRYYLKYNDKSYACNAEVAKYLKIYIYEEVERKLLEGPQKIRGRFTATFIGDNNGIMSVEKAYSSTGQLTILNIGDFDVLYTAMMDKGFKNITQSGMHLDTIDLFDIEFTEYNAMPGGSYIKSPKWVERRILNIQNKDEKCFEYAVTAAILNVNKNKERVSNYKNKCPFNMDGITYPVPICAKSFKKFESNNPDYALSVYTCASNSLNLDEVQPFYTNYKKDKNNIQLLVIQDVEDGRSHYTTIKDWNKFMYDGQNNTVHACHWCFTRFYNKGAEEKLKEHEERCKGLYEHAAPKIKLPKNDHLQFTNFKNTLKASFMYVIDFESTLVKYSEPILIGDTLTNTEKKTMHVPNSYFATCLDSNGDIIETFYDFGKDSAHNAIKTLLEHSDRMVKTMDKYKNCPKLTEEQKKRHLKAEKCCLCGEGKFCTDKTDTKMIKVRHHDHYTCEYIGPAHQVCNTRAKKVKSRISVFAHNMKGYDAHLLLKHAEAFARDNKLDCIANSSEKYISFNIGRLAFKDSASFLADKLDNLARALKVSDLKHTTKFISDSGYKLSDFLEFDKDEKRHVMRKGEYPYCWVKDDNKFNVKKLPPIEAWKSDLDGKLPDKKDYQYALKIWDATNCNTFKDYHDLYLKLDVYLLTDILHNSRNSFYDKYGLDMCHYCTLPGMSFDALLKMTGIKLEMIKDINMYEAFEQGIRGGITQVSHRYAKANNPDVDGYDKNLIKKWLYYLDATNLYGFSMCQNLPYKGFKWGDIEKYTLDYIMKNFDSKLIDPPDIKNYEIKKQEEKDDKHPDDIDEAMLCVDIDIPEHLHDKFKDLPLLPERMEITKEMNSKYQLNILGNNPISKCPKLVPNLFNKRNYWIHCKHLKFALEEGLILKKVNKVVEFVSRPWMRDYIVFNTQLRNKEKSEFGKKLWKLCNNAVYGKQLQNVRNQKDFTLTHLDTDKFRKLVRNPAFKRRDIISKNFACVESAQKEVTLDRPIYNGFCILELSKLHMYTFLYRHLKVMYPQTQLLYMDTDSFIFAIDSETRPVLKGKMFDNADLQKDDPDYNTDNEKILGCFTSETSGIPIKEIIMLQPKMYTYELCPKAMEKYKPKKVKQVVKKGKGIKDSVLKNDILLDQYRETLNTGVVVSKTQTSFRSFKHQIYTIKTNKKCLSAYENKRYILDDGKTSLPHGHYKIKELNK